MLDMLHYHAILNNDDGRIFMCEGDGMAARMMSRHASATGGDVAEAFELEKPTPAQVLEREWIAKQIKREEARLMSSVPRAESFSLRGSNRTADEPGQLSLI